MARDGQRRIEIAKDRYLDNFTMDRETDGYWIKLISERSDKPDI